MSEKQRDTVRRFVKQVDLAGRQRILDIGGGSGAYCINTAQTYPEIKAVVFDLPWLSG